ncbi:MAG: hypothetical protein N3B12_07680 [Armatimonadetes bacterium]|nr:hypothetical protein [Armatimonadota bacterium]
MLRLKRPRKVEGWALDVSETDTQLGRSTLWQRLADNNKVWIACLVGVVLLTFGLIKFSNREPVPKENYFVKPAGGRAGSPNDAAHKEFADRFVREQKGRLAVLDARFVSVDNFRITVSYRMSRDDAEFLAKLAGLKIVRRFRYRPVVQVYSKGFTGQPVLVATAHWETKKYGFVVKSYGMPGK